MPCRWVIDPDAVGTYGLNLNQWLEGDTIADVQITDQTPGILTGTPQISGDRTFVSVSGGTSGQRYHVTFHVTTAKGQEEDFTLTFDCRKR